MHVASTFLIIYGTHVNIMFIVEVKILELLYDHIRFLNYVAYYV